MSRFWHHFFRDAAKLDIAGYKNGIQLRNPFPWVIKLNSISSVDYDQDIGCPHHHPCILLDSTFLKLHFYNRGKSLCVSTFCQISYLFMAALKCNADETYCAGSFQFLCGSTIFSLEFYVLFSFSQSLFPFRYDAVVAMTILFSYPFEVNWRKAGVKWAVQKSFKISRIHLFRIIMNTLLLKILFKIFSSKLTFLQTSFTIQTGKFCPT